jgi:hypothetical protein
MILSIFTAITSLIAAVASMIGAIQKRRIDSITIDLEKAKKNERKPSVNPVLSS